MALHFLFIESVKVMIAWLSLTLAGLMNVAERANLADLRSRFAGGGLNGITRDSGFGT